jgi:hypothetical protein
MQFSLCGPSISISMTFAPPAATITIAEAPEKREAAGDMASGEGMIVAD